MLPVPMAIDVRADWSMGETAQNAVTKMAYDDDVADEVDAVAGDDDILVVVVAMFVDY